jgi:hypothetical protein
MTLKEALEGVSLDSLIEAVIDSTQTEPEEAWRINANTPVPPGRHQDIIERLGLAGIIGKETLWQEHLKVQELLIFINISIRGAAEKIMLQIGFIVRSIQTSEGTRKNAAA